MNAVILSVLIVVILSVARFPIVLSLITAAAVGGFTAGMEANQIVIAFNDALNGGAPVALAYASLGAFAVMLSRTGIADVISTRMIERISARPAQHTRKQRPILHLYAIFIIVGFASGTIVPIHIAFIPILVPPLLSIMNYLKMDRRAVSCAITFSLTVMYMTAPIGFGSIFLNDILTANINDAGRSLSFAISRDIAPKAMMIPAFGMVVGLLFAVFFSYRKERTYQDMEVEGLSEKLAPPTLNRIQKVGVASAVLVALGLQLWTGSMVFGGIAGFAVLSMTGIVGWREQDPVFTQGVRLMALVGFIMITASGFAGVMKATGHIPLLVDGSVSLIGDSRALAALVMLVVGLVITVGIGSSFSTVPIIAAIYVPLCLSLGFSAMATTALVGTAAALGDAGSPVSDSTLGPTAGLNADKQHDHIRDTVIPTFVHFNIPLIVFGWIAAMTL